jgi:hypothetical protein
MEVPDQPGERVPLDSNLDQILEVRRRRGLNSGGTPRIGSGATDGAHWRPGKMGLECPIFSGVRLKTMRWVWQSPDR